MTQPATHEDDEPAAESVTLPKDVLQRLLNDLDYVGDQIFDTDIKSWRVVARVITCLRALGEKES